jgi:hypothetical protein
MVAKEAPLEPATLVNFGYKQVAPLEPSNGYSLILEYCVINDYWLKYF